ncbi:MAG TPA: PHP-associated domain-containing protein, partial [Vicinamibacteria bacterium]|nr:PHP-associated domain-containing protein [Vicinamibacteria bacterium]
MTIRLMRCDLHVHSRHSGAAALPVIGRLGRECHSEPMAVYETARARGMDLFTLTDHDSIAGCLELAGRPDTFVSEEVTCLLPGGRQVHLGVFDLTEPQHEGIAARRADAQGLFAYLAEQRIPACLNHPFSGLTGARETGDLLAAFDAVRLVETRNGMIPATCNRRAAEAARDTGRAECGGSDAHTLASVARSWTAVKAATREEFLAGLRAARVIPVGRSGTYARLTRDVGAIVAGGLSERFREPVTGILDALSGVATAFLIPATLLVP